MRILLASRSRERLRLLREAGFRVDAEPQEVLEEKAKSPWEAELVVVANAVRKARAASSKYRRRIIVAADTLVYDGRGVYGKPSSPEEALSMLLGFRGRSVKVATGLVVAARGLMVCGVDRASVRFRNFSVDEAKRYVDTGEPLDKAGAFTIRGRGALLVERVEGHPSTVLGLPLHMLAEAFSTLGIGLG